MNKRLIIASFVVGVIALAVWIGLTWGGLGDRFDAGRDYGLISFYTIVGFDMVLLILGLGYRGRDRWLAFTLAAVLLTGFSLSWIYSLGGFLWPLGIILLVFSLGKLARYRQAEEPR